MEITAVSLGLVLVAGLAAGFFNVVAGGGSLLTVPALIFLGLPPSMANGTNRIAILSQNMVATARFHNKGYLPVKAGIILGVFAAVGAFIGSRFALDISGEAFNRILSVVMVVVLVLTLAGNRRKSTGDANIRRMPILIPVFFLLGIYGGFIQAGVGFIIIAAFSIIGGTNLVVTNAAKVMIVMIYTLPSLIVFIINGQVSWIPGLVLAAGNVAGGWLGAKFSMEKGDVWIKVLLTIAVSAMAIRLFFFS